MPPAGKRSGPGKRKKVFMIAGVCVLALLIIFVVAMAAFYRDLAGHLATGSQTYVPDIAAAGKAIIVYSPGWTGLTDKAVSHVAVLLTDRGYEVDVTGVSSGLAQDALRLRLRRRGKP